MDVPPHIVALSVGVLICWTLAYGLMIRRGVQDRTFAMPVTCVCANVAYEGLFSFHFPVDPLARYGNFLWLLFDLGLLYTCLRFGADDFVHPWLRRHFRVLTAGVLVVCIGFEWAFVRAFNDGYGQALSLATNSLVAFLMVAMALRRPHLRGQSFLIGLLLLLGNLPSPYLTFGYPTPNPPPWRMVVAVYTCILPLNILYVALLFLKCRKAGVNPWRQL